MASNAVHWIMGAILGGVAMVTVLQASGYFQRDGAGLPRRGSCSSLEAFSQPTCSFITGFRSCLRWYK
jgi:hypothetical protein